MSQLDLFSLPQPPPREDDFSASALECTARELLFRAGAFRLAPSVVVRWHTRLRTTAGMALPGKGLVLLNPRLVGFGMEEVDRTLRHELAHLLARFRNGRRRIQPHGPEWRQACVDLGLRDEKRCHDLPLPRRPMAPRHRYRCRQCGQEVLRVRPFRRAMACLKCCREHNRGRYDEKYRFVKITLDVATG